VYETYYCKRRDLAGILDLAHFFLAIFEGFGAALMRFFKSFFILLISQTWMNVPTIPEWVLRHIYMDSFHLAYMSFIYQQHTHNSPVLVAAAQIFVDIINQKHKEAAIKSKTQNKPILKRMRNMIRKGLFLKDNPELKQYKKKHQRMNSYTFDNEPDEASFNLNPY
jgi:hypothetical protein